MKLAKQNNNTINPFYYLIVPLVIIGLSLCVLKNKNSVLHLFNEKTTSIIMPQLVPWQSVGGCLQPMKIYISDLPMGAEAVLELSDMQAANFKKDNFNLYIPPGYRRQFLP